MDIFLSILISAGLGYIISKLDKIEEKFNKMENDIIKLWLLVDKRKGDREGD